MELRTNLFGLAVLVVFCLCGAAWAGWSEPVAVDELNTQYNEGSSCLSSDGLTLYFGRGQTDAFYYTRFYQATRSVAYGPFTSVEEISTLNYSGGHLISPWVSLDNLRLYYYRTEPGSRNRIKVSERATVADPWMPGVNIEELNAMGDVSFPTLSGDELTIVFSGELTGGAGEYDLWMATRMDRGSPFDNIRNLAEINSSARDDRPTISSDGLTLYFDSDRSGTGQFWRATRHSVDSPFSDPEHIDSFGTSIQSPSLSSDGRTLHFAKYIDPPGQFDIYVSYLEEDEDGLVGHWKFDEGDGSVAYDSAGDNDGTIYGAEWVDGFLDGALSFDGLGGDGVYIESSAGESSPLNIYDSDLTISVWVKCEGGGTVVARSEPYRIMYRLGISGESAYINTYTTSLHWRLYTNEIISQNDWYHIVGVFDRGTRRGRVYVNGIEEADAELGLDPPSDSGLTKIGCNNDTGNGTFTGSVDDVRIYDRVLSAGEVAELYGAEPEGGLVAHWKFDEAEGSVAYDSAGSNDGVVYGATWVDGVVEGALDFDGVDDYVAAPDDDALTGMSALTVSTWVRINTISWADRAGLVCKFYWDGDRAYVLELGRNSEADRSTVCWNVAPATDVPTALLVCGTTELQAGQWYHIAATFEADHQEIYVNGVEEADVVDGSIADGIPNNDQPLYIGYHTDEDSYFDGLMDDVRILDVALSAGEVLELYGEGPVEPVGLVSHWRFDEGEGSIAYDSAGTNDGDVYGVQWVDGVVVGGLEFDGADDYIHIADDDSLDVEEATFSTWLRINQLPANAAYLLAKAEDLDNEDSYRLRLNAAGQVHFEVEDSTHVNIEMITDNPVSSGEWLLVTATYNLGDARLYVNGSEVSTQVTGASTRPLYVGSGRLTVGARFDSSENSYRFLFDGVMDEIQIYDVALSAGEIAELFGQVTLPGKAYHVDGLLGSDDNDGLSRETAFASIGKGIDSAEDGDIVLVWPGVYGEEVRFMGKAITVRSAGDAATIENPDDFAVSFYYGEGPGSALKNFVIANSLTGIFIAGSSPTISNVTVVNNMFGIEAYAGSEPDISNAILWDNIESDIYGCEAAYSWIQGDFGLPEPSDEGLVAHWKFDEGESGTAYDSVGGHHGILYGATWADGFIDGALTFDGIDDYVLVNDHASLDVTNVFTFSGWIRKQGNGRTILSHDGVGHDPSYSYNFYIDDDLKVCYETNNSPSFATEPGTISLDTWHQVAVACDDAENPNMRIYIDGAEKATANVVAPRAISYEVMIGRRGYTSVGSFFNGAIDDLRIYNRPLTAEEIVGLSEPGGDSDPFFANPAAGDYHLRSARGRYWAEHGVWVLDDENSPCLDGGDPDADYSGERAPNGGIINMGAFGGSYYASMTEWLICGDVNGDGVTNMVDFSLMADNWLGMCGGLKLAPAAEPLGP